MAAVTIAHKKGSIDILCSCTTVVFGFEILLSQLSEFKIKSSVSL